MRALVLLLLISSGLISAVRGQSPETLGISLLKGPVVEAYENEYKAIIEVLAEQIYQVPGNSRYKAIFHATDSDLIASIKTGKSDFIVIDPYTYCQARFPKTKVNLIGCTAELDHQMERLLLIGSADDKAKPTPSSKFLYFSPHFEQRILKTWIRDYFKLKSDQPFTIQFPSAMPAKNKSSALHATFFKRTEFCIIPQQAYETLTELNPQLKTKLRIIAESFPYPNGLVMVRKNSIIDNAEAKEKTLTLHNTPAGKQILESSTAAGFVKPEESHFTELEAAMQRTIVAAGPTSNKDVAQAKQPAPQP